MAGRFVNPFPQYLDATPTVRAGAKLFFYAAGTSTKLDTYSDRSLSSVNLNPIVLNSAGYPSVDIYLQDLDYKVVLAPSTDTDPPTSPIWSADYVRARDSALVAKTITGSGSPNGAVAGTAGSSSVLPDFYWDYTNSILYVCTTTGTNLTAVWTAVNASSAAAVVPAPQGYLSLNSGTPSINGDVVAGTSVFYEPYVGNLIPLYNGTSFVPTAFTAMALVLSSSHVANNIYDVYVFNNSGVPTIVTGPTWSAGTSGSITAGSCARGTGAGGSALSLVNGIYTNAAQITGRNGATTYTIAANLATYVGSIFMDGTNGQITCHRSWGSSRKWGVWNAYNRIPIEMRGGDSTASWAGTTAGVIRAARADTANKITTFTGLAEEIVVVHLLQALQAQMTSGTGGSAGQRVGIGVNVTNAFSGTIGQINLSNGSSINFVQTVTVEAAHTLAPTLGINNITAIEDVLVAGALNTFFGTETNMRLTARYMG